MSHPAIDGRTALIAHIGWPTHSFTAPRIYNPWFVAAGVNAVVVPMACRDGDLAAVLPALFRLGNVIGALVTMPHKVAVLGLLDEASPAVQLAGSCNAVRRAADGRLQGELFDGLGFVRALERRGVMLPGRQALVVGSGGVGAAIAAALLEAGAAGVTVSDTRAAAAEALAQRLHGHFPGRARAVAAADAAGFDLVVNATPLGMADGDALPFDVAPLTPATVVGDVVLRATPSPLLRAAAAAGCTAVDGRDMLFEQIPAYLAWFGLPVADADTLRGLARLEAPPDAGPVPR